MAKELGVSVGTVSAWTKGKLTAPYDLRFLREDGELRSYFLGLFVADGWLEERGRAAYVALNDRQIVDDVAQALQYRNKIVEIPLRKWGSSELSGKISHRIGLAREPLQDLMALGFTATKTGNEFVPAGLSESTFHHFLRGVSDGDGTMSLVRNRSEVRLQWSLVSSSEEFLEEVLEHLHTVGAVAHGVEVLPRDTPSEAPMFKIMLGHADSVRVGSYMYADATLLLRRKFQTWKRGATVVTAHRRWTKQEIEMARQGEVPAGRTRNAYLAMRRRIRLGDV